MRKLLFIILLMSIGCTTFAQKKNLVFVKIDTFDEFINNSNMEAIIKELASKMPNIDHYGMGYSLKLASTDTVMMEKTFQKYKQQFEYLTTIELVNEKPVTYVSTNFYLPMVSTIRTQQFLITVKRNSNNEEIYRDVVLDIRPKKLALNILDSKVLK